MELQGGGDVFGKVDGIVAAGIDVEFMRDVARGKDLIESAGAGVEAVVVFVAAVEIDFEAGELRGAGEDDGIIAVPKRGIGRIAEDGTEDARAWRTGGRAAEEAGESFDERGAVGADGAEELRMAEGEMQRAVATHGNAGDGAIGAARSDAITLFDEGEKFLEKKVLVAILPVAGVDVEAGAAVGGGDGEVLELMSLAHVIYEIPEAGVDEELFVVAEAVKVIEDGEFSGFVGVEGGGKDDAVADGAGEDFGGKGVTFDAGRSRSGGEAKKAEEGNQEKKWKKPLIHSGGRRRG